MSAGYPVAEEGELRIEVALAWKQGAEALVAHGKVEVEVYHVVLSQDVALDNSSCGIVEKSRATYQLGVLTPRGELYASRSIEQERRGVFVEPPVLLVERRDYILVNNSLVIELRSEILCYVLHGLAPVWNGSIPYQCACAYIPRAVVFRHSVALVDIASLSSICNGIHCRYGQ